MDLIYLKLNFIPNTSGCNGLKKNFLLREESSLVKPCRTSARLRLESPNLRAIPRVMASCRRGLSQLLGRRRRGARHVPLMASSPSADVQCSSQSEAEGTEGMPAYHSSTWAVDRWHKASHPTGDSNENICDEQSDSSVQSLLKTPSHTFRKVLRLPGLGMGLACLQTAASSLTSGAWLKKL